MGIRIATVCDGYQEIQVSKETFVDIQRVIGGLVDEIPADRFTSRLKELLIFYARMRGPGIGWLVKPTLKAREGSRLKMVGLDALLTCRRMVAWFPGTMDDTGRHFQQLCRLNQGVDTNHSRVYERKEERNGARTVFSIESTSVTVLERMGWRQFSSVEQAIFSLLGVRPKGIRKRQGWTRRRWLNMLW